MFTDWSIATESSRYFYLRGALWGVVISSLFWCIVVPWLKDKVGR